ncbi:pyrroloquinoline quinone biosynthesis protein D [Solimonas aquatica]|uniref:PqqA binding protein n=1 Tax=Solimonas aquatica TaxID=489703 RepID=A0A1H9GN13_9GAMM|nr:pyrroloquinoline quinone biosynthesis peptide chaperone PqqD [Solimonas aquatica]SEQ51517.1 pyrroloquinoline quinone biosynthesis protein D [Solimonas aquatica]
MDSGHPCIRRGFRLQWEEAQQAHVLLYPEGMVKLNASAGAILSRCDGARSVPEIIAELEQQYACTGLEPEVRAFLNLATEQRWLQWA